MNRLGTAIWDLLRIAEEMSFAHLKKCGEFSKGSKLYFHGFGQLSHLRKALQQGSFGRGHSTSIGTPLSHGVPYFNKIWFRKPSSYKIRPVFYTTKRDYPYGDILRFLADKWSLSYGELQINQGGYKSEQEWYYNGIMKLSRLPLVMVVYNRQNTSPEEVEEIEALASKYGVGVSPNPWP